MSLEERWKDGFIQVWCKVCNEILVEFDENTWKGWVIGDCQHFKWEKVVIKCFYDYDMYKEECEPYHDRQYVERLKKKYILRVDSGELYFLLVPREGEEE
jgi:hypothetical protein